MTPAGHANAMCTILAKNYIAHARTLIRSFQALHPECACYALIVDDHNAFLNPHEEGFDILALSDLDIVNVPSFCFKYNLTELCTAAKPYLLNHLIQQRGVKKLLYLDPDIMVVNGLNGLYDRLDDFDVVLTPHVETDFPDDGRLPDDAAVLQTGLFNLGFIGVRDSNGTKRFLDWWQRKLADKCVVDVPSGFFVDQKFIDLASVLFNSIFVEKDPGYNMAYWNLHSRCLSGSPDDWRCNDGPLYFFHFSGYQQEDRQSLTTHIAKEDMRYQLADRPDIQPIFAEYCAQVEANGYTETRQWPYTYASFSDGSVIPYAFRKLYRQYLPEMEPYGNPFESKALARRLRMKQLIEADTPSARMVAGIYRGVPGMRSTIRRLMRP